MLKIKTNNDQFIIVDECKILCHVDGFVLSNEGKYYLTKRLSLTIDSKYIKNDDFKFLISHWMIPEIEITMHGEIFKFKDMKMQSCENSINKKSLVLYN